MGYSCSMLFFPEAGREQALAVSGMVETSEEDECNEELFSGGEPAPGTYLIWQNWDTGALESSDYLRIASGTKLVVCDICETTMFCSTTAFERGRLVWNISHDAGQGPDNIEVEGELPPTLSATVERLMEKAKAAQAADDDVDYFFEVPVELFREISGARHDVENDFTFHVLERAGNPPKKPFWKFWN